MSEQFVLEDIPYILNRLRTRSGLTFKDLSEQSGLSLSYLSDIERARTTPTIETLGKIVATQGYMLTFSLESPDKTFEFFGHIETQIIHALEKRDFERALVLIAALVQPEGEAK